MAKPGPEKQRRLPHDKNRSLPAGPRSPSACQLLHYSHSPLPFLEQCAVRDFQRLGKDECEAMLRAIAKFIIEARFKHDIRKLAALPNGDRRFLMVMVTDTPLSDLDNAPNPRKGKQLDPAQVAAVITYWARSRPAAVRSFTAGTAWCHLFLWNVCACSEDEIEVRDGFYLLATSAGDGVSPASS